MTAYLCALSLEATAHMSVERYYIYELLMLNREGDLCATKECYTPDQNIAKECYTPDSKEC